MAQKVVGYVKLQIPAGKATPAPPVGPALGQHGVNIAAFTKEFNERTKNDMGLIIPVVITVYADRSFTFITKTPPAAVLIKKECNIESLSLIHISATVFALEVISVGVLYYAGLVPCLTAALTGYLVSVLMGVPPTRFTVTVPGLEVRTMLLVMVLALLCAVVSILFCRGLHGVEHLLKRTLKNPYLRVAVGAAVLIGLTLLTNGDYNGAGMEVIGRAIAGQADPWAWVWKLLFTAITIGCGFKGGEVVPSFFVGAAFGCVAAGWLGLPAGFGAAMGLVSVFCGAVNCPLASIILSVELFGSGDLLYFAMACSISYLISGYCGLYSSQTILYSKLRAEFINVRTHE